MSTSAEEVSIHAVSPLLRVLSGGVALDVGCRTCSRASRSPPWLGRLGLSQGVRGSHKQANGGAEAPKRRLHRIFLSCAQLEPT